MPLHVYSRLSDVPKIDTRRTTKEGMPKNLPVASYLGKPLENSSAQCAVFWKSAELQAHLPRLAWSTAEDSSVPLLLAPAATAIWVIGHFPLGDG